MSPAATFVAARLTWLGTPAAHATLVVFDPGNGEVRAMWQLDRAGRGGAIAIDPSGDRVAEWTASGEFVLRQVGIEAPTLRLELAAPAPVAMAFRDDGDLMARDAAGRLRRVRLAALAAALHEHGVGFEPADR